MFVSLLSLALLSVEAKVDWPDTPIGACAPSCSDVESDDCRECCQNFDHETDWKCGTDEAADCCTEWSAECFWIRSEHNFNHGCKDCGALPGEVASVSHNCPNTVPGQGEYGQWGGRGADATVEECIERCHKAEGCVAIDFAEGRRVDSCRLYASAENARIGNGGKDSRVFCSMETCTGYGYTSPLAARGYHCVYPACDGPIMGPNTKLANGDYNPNCCGKPMTGCDHCHCGNVICCLEDENETPRSSATPRPTPGPTPRPVTRSIPIPRRTPRPTPRPIPVVASACENKNGQCPKWASEGECAKNPSYMNANCKQACGLCHCLPNPAEDPEVQYYSTEWACDSARSGMNCEDAPINCRTGARAATWAFSKYYDVFAPTGGTCDFTGTAYMSDNVPYPECVYGLVDPQPQPTNPRPTTNRNQPTPRPTTLPPTRSQPTSRPTPPIVTIADRMHCLPDPSEDPLMTFYMMDFVCGGNAGMDCEDAPFKCRSDAQAATWAFSKYYDAVQMKRLEERVNSLGTGAAEFDSIVQEYRAGCILETSYLSNKLPYPECVYGLVNPNGPGEPNGSGGNPPTTSSEAPPADEEEPPAETEAPPPLARPRQPRPNPAPENTICVPKQGLAYSGTNSWNCVDNQDVLNCNDVPEPCRSGEGMMTYIVSAHYQRFLGTVPRWPPAGECNWNGFAELSVFRMQPDGTPVTPRHVLAECVAWTPPSRGNGAQARTQSEGDKETKIMGLPVNTFIIIAAVVSTLILGCCAVLLVCAYCGPSEDEEYFIPKERTRKKRRRRRRSSLSYDDHADARSDDERHGRKLERARV